MTIFQPRNAHENDEESASTNDADATRQAQINARWLPTIRAALAKAKEDT